MAQDDEPAGDVRRHGAGMLGAMAALWSGDAAGNGGEDLPSRYTTATLLLWTLMGVVLAAGFHLFRSAIGTTSPAWLAAALVMFVPLVLAWSTNPPRRTAGVVCGLLLGVVAGIVVAVGLPALGVAVPDLALMVLIGLAVAALVAAGVFGAVTRDRRSV